MRSNMVAGGFGGFYAFMIGRDESLEGAEFS